MKERFLKWAVALAAILMPTQMMVSAQEPETISDDENAAFVQQSSDEFMSSFDPDVTELFNSGFGDGLVSPVFGSMSSESRATLIKQIIDEAPIDTVAAGEPGVKYDVILQPGHYGRKTGKTGAQGKLVSERALVAHVVRNVHDRLQEAGFKVLVISADNYIRDVRTTSEWEGLDTRIFISVHADGSLKPCAVGPSLSYKEAAATHAMHAFGWALAQSLGFAYEDFMKDGYTSASANYYMFKNVKADILAGLLELGEISCEEQETVIVDNVDLLSRNIAHTIKFLLEMPTASSAQR
jgi:N-acetylmuramoyl-L-alanine amidase